MLEIAICDDELMHLKYTHNILKSVINDCKISAYNDANELLDVITEDSLHFDIVLLDIDMGNITGIDIAKTINKINPMCQIIFVTGYINYALDVYDTNHIYFILKNEVEKRLPIALTKALDNLKHLHEDSLIIKQKNNYISININDIIYLERIKRVTAIICLEHEITVYEKLSDLYKKINQNYFIYCHNSYIVQLNRITEFKRNEFIMCNGNSVPISRKFYNDVKIEFLRFVGDKI